GGVAPSPVVTPAAEEPALVAQAVPDGNTGHRHVSGSSMLFAPDEDEPIRARLITASAPLPPVGGRADGPRSVAVAYGDRTARRVSLTFDAGADVGFAADILDTLARERVVASFGMTGAWAEQHPALVKRIADEDHHFINHSWSHGSFTGLSTTSRPMTRAERWDELDRTEAIIQRIAGVSTLPYFRPPYGDTDASVLADVGARGYAVTAMWAVDSLGWNGLSAPGIVERTLRLTSPGAIVIFHVGAQSQDAAALPAIIRGLREAGYEFVSVATLTGG
ncbi:MAG: polysaccharide deacetylase family protein, partial [Chloroflexi bacterium]|nr:polysaccharide deacetylase family protein [Chloroflexota bacterium]